VGVEGDAQMKFRIHWQSNGEDDSFIVEAATIEEIREKANAELEDRGITVDDEPWSEELVS
jgi:hypothetical protein